MRAFWIVLVQIILTQLILGCDHRQAVSVVPTTAPASQPTTAPARVEPFSITVDQHDYDFPPARLVLSTNDNQFSALLLTDDPANAASSDYQGNSLYLQMSMDIPDNNTLAGAQWTIQSAETQRSEEIDGIYLHGQRKFLQPSDVRVTVENDTPPIKVRVQGTFLLFDDEDQSDPPAEPKKVQVSAEISTRMQLKGSSATAAAR